MYRLPYFHICKNGIQSLQQLRYSSCSKTVGRLNKKISTQKNWARDCPSDFCLRLLFHASTTPRSPPHSLVRVSWWFHDGKCKADLVLTLVTWTRQGEGGTWPSRHVGGVFFCKKTVFISPRCPIAFRITSSVPVCRLEIRKGKRPTNLSPQNQNKNVCSLLSCWWDLFTVNSSSSYRLRLLRITSFSQVATNEQGLCTKQNTWHPLWHHTQKLFERKVRSFNRPRSTFYAPPFHKIKKISPKFFFHFVFLQTWGKIEHFKSCFIKLKNYTLKSLC